VVRRFPGTLIAAVALLSGCAQVAVESGLPPLCPSSDDLIEADQRAAALRGRRESSVIAHYGPPAQRLRDVETAMDILVWGPLRITYRRRDGQTVPHDCTVEMYVNRGLISRTFSRLTPP
jgi:hypothetical protein